MRSKRNTKSDVSYYNPIPSLLSKLPRGFSSVLTEALAFSFIVVRSFPVIFSHFSVILLITWLSLIRQNSFNNYGT